LNIDVSKHIAEKLRFPWKDFLAVYMEAKIHSSSRAQPVENAFS
jgi:hypothetical protein